MSSLRKNSFCLRIVVILLFFILFYQHPVILTVRVWKLPSCWVNDTLMADSSLHSSPLSQLFNESISLQVAANDGCFQIYRLRAAGRFTPEEMTFLLYPEMTTADFLLRVSVSHPLVFIIFSKTFFILQFKRSTLNLNIAVIQSWLNHSGEPIVWSVGLN